ncbi:MAG: hypothetical protein ACFCD0_29675 [Gemmataceae bacterium]
MRRAVTFVAMVSLLVVLSGCGDDPVGEDIGKIFSQANQATSKMDSATTKLNNALTNSKTKKITKKDLKSALEDLVALRDVGKELLSLRAKVVTLVTKHDLSDKDKQAELAAKHRGNLRQAFEDVGNAQEKLEQAVAKILELPEDRCAQSAKDELKAELRRSRQEFEVLTRGQ